MRRRIEYLTITVVVAVLWLPVSIAALGGTEFPDPPPGPSFEELLAAGTTQTAVFAGGCFWGVEGVFERLIGVIDASSGYSGGDESTAQYRKVSSGTTQHAESVEIVFDPSVVSYGTLLEIFFAVAHDPTQLNYQGPDRGPEYRSVIFYASEEQKRLAEEYIGTLDDANVFADPIVTEVVALDSFFPAEEYHQDFMEKNPMHGYVVRWDIPKIEYLEKYYPDLVR